MGSEKNKKPSLGEYVLVTKFADKDPLDPWYVGFVSEIIFRPDGTVFKVDGSPREWKNCFRITQSEGSKWIDLYGDKPDIQGSNIPDQFPDPRRRLYFKLPLGIHNDSKKEK